MNIDFILDKLLETRLGTAVITGDKSFTFGDIFSRYEKCREKLEAMSVPSNSVVALLAEFSPSSIAMFLSLISQDCIIVPISRSVKDIEAYLNVSQSEWFIDVQGETFEIKHLGHSVTHPLLAELKSKKEPGLILFSSGTTAEPKAALHNLLQLMEKFKKPGKTLKTIAFLLFDHIGGFNTMMHALANGGTIVTVSERTPDEVCKAIEQNSIELLPTSPTFLNMILMSKSHQQYDLSSLKIISYGTEPMPQSTLQALNRILPEVHLKQTYGLSEVGIMATKSESSDSLYLKIGGDGFETKIVDDILYIRAESAMLGYLNAPSPFDEEGWFNTKDRVEIKGDYIKILGRTTDLINVGGEKVYPIEVESLLLQCDGVLDVRVYGEPNPLMGKVVAAEVRVAPENDNRDFVKKLRAFCSQKLEKYKIPVKIRLTQGVLFGDRLKKKR
jgi:acyl-CoA synthetase (AMP-forming)/AMP-acid ligase II